MDTIKIENLEVYAYHGVFAEEKSKGQHFYVNATLKTELKKAGMTDDLKDSTHYGEVCLQIQKSMTENCYDLIERAAEVTIEDILLKFPLIKEVCLEIRKPEAPIPMKFQSVSVQITRGWHKVYIAFGSNMGDSKKIIQDALESIKNHRFYRNLRSSEMLISSPYGGVEQNDYVNGVIEVETMYTPWELLDSLHELDMYESLFHLKSLIVFLHTLNQNHLF